MHFINHAVSYTYSLPRSSSSLCTLVSPSLSPLSPLSPSVYPLSFLSSLLSPSLSFLLLSPFSPHSSPPSFSFLPLSLLAPLPLSLSPFSLFLLSLLAPLLPLSHPPLSVVFPPKCSDYQIYMGFLIGHMGTNVLAGIANEITS